MSGIKAAPRVLVDIPAPFLPLFKPKRYKVYYGGRGGAKSWGFAQALIVQSMQAKHRILCTREFQNSIADSVHTVVRNRIAALGFEPFFDITQNSIRCRITGSEFIYKGLRRNINEIRSLEGVTRVWMEEGQSTSKESWLLLDPTIRAEGSEIWVSYNPVDDSDPTHQMFVVGKNKMPDALVVKVSYRDNPWFPAELERQRLYMKALDPDAYAWVWEGETRHISEAAIFRGRYVVEGFETPETVDRFFYGVDWGFANDPTVMIRCYIVNDELFIDQEAYAIGCEIDDLPALFAGGIAQKNGAVYAGVPGAREWPIKADNARPETISYLRRKGFNIDGAEKWQGCVEDGIAHLKAFKKIHVHERCVNTAQECRLYSYKIDQKTQEILPIVVDKFNHCIDSIRYSLDGYIQQRGGLGVWAKLAG